MASHLAQLKAGRVHRRRAKWTFGRFLLVTAGPAVLAALLTGAAAVYINGKHANRITLSDLSAGSIAVATDLDAYRVLLGARPSPAWETYYDDVVVEKGLRLIFKGDIQIFRQLQSYGRILQLPNGTRAEQADRIVLTVHDTAGSVAAIKFRVRMGPQKGLIAYTSPSLLQHDIAPFF